MKRESALILAILSVALFVAVNPCSGEVLSVDTPGQILEVSDDIQPYNGTIGAGSALYGLKIAMENLDETFTLDETERLEKQINHANLRLAEIKKELTSHQNSYAERALEEYLRKLNRTEGALISDGVDTARLLRGEQEIAKQQLVLENLLRAHPEQAGLTRAYNSSHTMEDLFEQKTGIRFNRVKTEENRTILQTERLVSHPQSQSGKSEQKDTDRIDTRVQNQEDGTVSTVPARSNESEEVKGKKGGQDKE
jgi:hypothetical protein